MTDLAQHTGRATDWLCRHVPELTAPLQFEPILGGHSNITMRVTDRVGHRAALRRPPYGQLPRGAHDVVREARIVSALASSPVPVPAVLAVCVDETVLGAPFSVTAWIDGAALAAPQQVGDLLPTPDDRRRATDALLCALAALHQVDPDVVGPARPLERQIDKLSAVWDSVRTRDLPEVLELSTRLLDAHPAGPRIGVVHSDFRLGNCMFGADGRLLAVLDWELAQVGDVLADLGYLLNNWEQPDEPGPKVWMQTPPTRAGGFPERAALIARYQQLTGFEVDDVSYYRAFTAWRMAIIAEGIKRRYASAAMVDRDIDHGYLDRRVRDLLAQADQHLRAIGG